jgi:putative hydrolase of the HAD superfamily
MMCAALEVKPSQCIYLDDLGINCKPAAAMGMAAIKVTSGVQALNDLGALLALTFTPLGV